MLFAVAETTGLTSIAGIKEKKVPLHLSIRRNQAHGTRFLIDHVLEANGFSLKDFESWGGTFHWVDTPNGEDRLGAIRDGSITAVFDEGVKGWGVVAAKSGMRFLPLDPAAKQRLDELGWAVAPCSPYSRPLRRTSSLRASAAGPSSPAPISLTRRPTRWRRRWRRPGPT
jgi:hypothetical protein